MNKICSKCTIEKDICEFYFEKTRNRYTTECKNCYKERQKKYVKDNYDIVMQRNKRYQESNPNKMKIIKQRWKKNHPECIKRDNVLRSEKIKEWGKKNRKILNKKKVERRRSDIDFKIRCNLRSRISTIIKNNVKVGSAIKDLGCSLDCLKKYLKNKFYNNPETGEKMTFENYGKWHIDHIKPLSSFDLANRDQFLAACHYNNLQPLWAKDNLHKSNKLDWEK
ncbi:MAG TPA: hypothetical protein ENI23_00420 [bacterium]|nr:hypothetical protein [bacterium]